MKKITISVFLCILIFIPVINAEDKPINSTQLSQFWLDIESGSLTSTQFCEFVQSLLTEEDFVSQWYHDYLKKIPFSDYFLAGWVKEIKEKYYTINELNPQGMIIFYDLVRKNKINHENFQKFIDSKSENSTNIEQTKISEPTMYVFWQLVKTKDIRLYNFREFLTKESKTLSTLKELQELLELFLSSEERRFFKFLKDKEEEMMKKSSVTVSSLILYYSLRKHSEMDEKLNKFLFDILDRRSLELALENKKLRENINLKDLPQILKEKYQNDINLNKEKIENYSRLLAKLHE